MIRTNKHTYPESKEQPQTPKSFSKTIVAAGIVAMTLLPSSALAQESLATFDHAEQTQDNEHEAYLDDAQSNFYDESSDRFIIDATAVLDLGESSITVRDPYIFVPETQKSSTDVVIGYHDVEAEGNLSLVVVEANQVSLYGDARKGGDETTIGVHSAQGSIEVTVAKGGSKGGPDSFVDEGGMTFGAILPGKPLDKNKHVLVLSQDKGPFSIEPAPRKGGGYNNIDTQ